MEWKDCDTLKLIELYEANEFLWNSKHADYRNRLKKNVKFGEFSVLFGCEPAEIQRKIHNLRNQVSHELQKLRKRKSGAGSDEVEFVSSWKFFNALKFVIPTCMPTATESNLMNTGRDAELGNVESNEAAEKNKELPENENKKKKRKQASEDDDAILKEALAIMKKPKDDFDRFGEYVALELRTMKSEFYRGKLKQEIRAAVARITAEDENYYWSLTSPSTSSSGPPTPFALE